MPDPDLEAVRARVRTAVDRWTGTDTLVLDKADVLALLAPTLTEEERWLRDRLHQRSEATVPDPLDAVRAEGRRLLAKIMNEVEYKEKP